MSCVIRHQIVTTSTPGSVRAADYGRDVAKILIVEDDNVIADGMARHLDAAGFDPIVVGRGELGLARLRFENPDVCVLDLMLPELDGWKLIETARVGGDRHADRRRLRARAPSTTACTRSRSAPTTTWSSRSRCASSSRASARPRAAACAPPRSGAARRSRSRSCGSTRARCRRSSTARAPALTPTEFKLLYTLALDRGRVVTRDELLQKVWGRRETHRDRTVDVFVRRLRQKIDRIAPTHTFIQTRFGVGYKLEPEPK